jgi:hypothetical protein
LKFIPFHKLVDDFDEFRKSKTFRLFGGDARFQNCGERRVEVVADDHFGELVGAHRAVEVLVELEPRCHDGGENDVGARRLGGVEEGEPHLAKNRDVAGVGFCDVEDHVLDEGVGLVARDVERALGAADEGGEEGDHLLLALDVADVGDHFCKDRFAGLLVSLRSESRRVGVSHLFFFCLFFLKFFEF